jgi:hypothetical protein
LTSDANTIYLTCQSNRFVDNSSNGYTFTATGTPSVQAFSPFPTTAAYSAGTNGGSGYFDGTGDYLTLPSGAAFQFGTGNFTVECWFYVSATGLQYLFDARNSGQTNAWALHVTPSSGNIVWFNGSADWTVNTTLRINSWNHIAYVRETTTGSMFLNGVRLSTQTDSTNYSVSPTTSTIAARNNNVENVNGYLADVRVVKGTAVYSGTTYTVPTAPLTAITNTSLLLSGTNGGIIDNTMSNNLETVGGASISTTQSKWGGSSMFFDGNGDYLIMPNVLTGQFRTGDFTIEYWDFHGTQGTNYADQVGNLSSASPSGTWRFGTFSNLGGLYFAYHNGSAYVDVVFGSAAYNDSAWRHFAISRYNGVLIAFVNGIQVGAVTACTQDFNSSNRVILGAELVNPTYFTGYLQDVRVTKGIARYVQNFTPPIQAFQLL